jgi:hypothetical protein
MKVAFLDTLTVVLHISEIGHRGGLSLPLQEFGKHWLCDRVDRLRGSNNSRTPYTTQISLGIRKIDHGVTNWTRWFTFGGDERPADPKYLVSL